MGKHLEHCLIYAVDFDGTLCESRFPEIGSPNMHLIEWLIEFRKAGNKVILWTNRVGHLLDNAVNWCAAHGLEFDAVNDNLPEVVELYKDLNGNSPSRKITADIFIDDAACSEGLPFGGSKGCTMVGCWCSPSQACQKAGCKRSFDKNKRGG